MHKDAFPGATREHVTIEHLHSRGPFSFSVPEVHHHSEAGGRYYLVLSQIPGQTLNSAWPGMDEETKGRWVRCVADICKELEAWSARPFTSITVI